MRFERSGRGQEPSRGHKFSILENVVLHRDFTSSMRLHFRSDLVGVALVGATPLHLLSQTALPLKSPTGAFIAALRFANAVPPQTLLKTDEEELCQFDTIPPTIEKTERSRRGTPCCTYLCRMWIFQGASGWAHPIFVSSWLGVRQNAFTGSFSPWLYRGWFCAVPPSGRTIPPLQGRREQRRHWFWYPVRRSFPCPQRTA